MSRWRALFADLPEETLVHARQDAYYRAIADSTKAASATPFVLFMLTMIRAALDEISMARPSRPNKLPNKSPNMRPMRHPGSALSPTS
jgi:hypothetical protein